MNTVLDVLIAKAREKGQYSPGFTARPSCVLWTDRDRLWEPVLSLLRQAAPDLLVLGDYCPAERRGPALWLRAVLDGALSEVVPLPENVPPIVYLPGWSRGDLRAIATCPEDLKFLSEFQYRGAIFAHPNGRDWTPWAFLSASRTKGGLGIKISSDAGTKEALLVALEEILQLDIAKVENASVDAAFLNGLVVTDLPRDVLDWMESPDNKPQKWGPAKKSSFEATCAADLGWKPGSEGPHGAAEKLVRGDKGWQGIWDRYLETKTRYPNIYKLLAARKAPSDLFSDLSRYPSVNEKEEESLRKALIGLPEDDPVSARTRIVDLENTHGKRRSWPWADLGRSNLSRALESLAELANLTAEGGGASDLSGMIRAYKEKYWRVDAAALRALELVESKLDREAVSKALRSIYLPWLEQHAYRTQELGLGRYPSDAFERSPRYDAGTCVLFVDGLRFDLACRLADDLNREGCTTELSAQWGALPSVTSIGKYLRGPVPTDFRGILVDGEPALSDTDGLKIDSIRHKALLSGAGIEVLGADETGSGTGVAWTEHGEIDSRGHEIGSRIARELPAIMGMLRDRIVELLDAGWQRVRVVTDHGWLMMPGGLPKAGLPASFTLGKWGRSGVLNPGAPDVTGSYPWPLDCSVRMTSAPGARSYIEGREYAHGGLSLQEAYVPTLVVKSSRGGVSTAEIVRITWTGLRCDVEIRPNRSDVVCDIRLAATKPETTIVSAPKPFRQGRSSIPVVRDDLEGHAALIVVLDGSGVVLAQESVEIGGR